MNRKKVLIVGINGFLGRNLKQAINGIYPSWKVYGLDKKGKTSGGFFKLNIRKENKLKKVILKIKPDFIFNLSGKVADDNFRKLILSNVVDTYILLKVIMDIKNYNPRIIIPSSAAEYGRVESTKLPIREDYPLKPQSLYGLSKMVQTSLANLFSMNGLDIVIARIFNIFGPGTPRDFSVGKFAFELAQINKKKKKAVLITKNLDTKRDFLDIRDVSKYLVSVARYGKKGEVYNICSGKSYKIKNLLNQLLNISGVGKIKIYQQDKSYNKNSDIFNSIGSTAKLKKIARTAKLIPIDKSLRDTYLYYYSKV